MLWVVLGWINKIQYTILCLLWSFWRILSNRQRFIILFIGFTHILLMYKIVDYFDVLLLMLWCLALVLSKYRSLELVIWLCLYWLRDHISYINIANSTIYILLNLLCRVHILKTYTAVMVVLYSTATAIQNYVSQSVSTSKWGVIMMSSFKFNIL